MSFKIHRRWSRLEEAWTNYLFNFVRKKVFASNAIDGFHQFDRYDKVQLIFVHGWVCVVQCDEENKKKKSPSYLASMYSATPNDNTRYSLNNSSLLINHERFDLKRKTVLFCHGAYVAIIWTSSMMHNVNRCTLIASISSQIFSGWMDDLFSEGAQRISKAYIKRNDHNIIILDWGQYSVSDLMVAVIRSSFISQYAVKSIYKLFELGLKARDFHCVGHSIGGM